jgi:hypothetical protein
MDSETSVQIPGLPGELRQNSCKMIGMVPARAGYFRDKLKSFGVDLLP